MTTAAEWLVQAASLSAQDKADIAAAVLAAAQVTPIHSDAKAVNGVVLAGAGVPVTDPWRPA